MKILIQNGRVIDPASGFDQVCDISLAAGRIIAINRAVADAFRMAPAAHLRPRRGSI